MLRFIVSMIENRICEPSLGNTSDQLHVINLMFS